MAKLQLSTNQYLELSAKVLNLIKQGLTHKQIAKELHCSHSQVWYILTKANKRFEAKQIKKAKDKEWELAVKNIVKNNKLNKEEKAKALWGINLPYYRIAQLLHTTKDSIYSIINGASMTPPIIRSSRESWVEDCLDCLAENPCRTLDSLRQTLLQEPKFLNKPHKVNEIIEEVKRQFSNNSELLWLRQLNKQAMESSCHD